jgi:heme-degrading monooxygenase HmoA
MTLVRQLFISVDPGAVEEAIRMWKVECAQLMIAAPGCLGERLLVATDCPGELISFSEWRDREDIDAYEASSAHEQIKQHAARMPATGSPVVKVYEIGG